MSRGAPRPLATALRRVLDGGPQTALARVQAVWGEALGEGIATAAAPAGERAGIVSVACQSATWAQELSLMHDELLARLNAALEASGAPPVQGFRFDAMPPHAEPAQRSPQDTV